KAQAVACMNNTKQLLYGWILFSSDNNGFLMNNGAVTFSGNTVRWVGGSMDWTAGSDNTNSSMLIDPAQSAIANYCRSAGIFKCPADKYQSPANRGPRVRSISMNSAIGGSPQLDNQMPNRQYIAAKKESDLT